MTEKQIAECADRLDMELSAAMGVDALDIIQSRAKELIAAVRKETREECARVCEEFSASFADDVTDCSSDNLQLAADAIRNLQEREEGKR